MTAMTVLTEVLKQEEKHQNFQFLFDVLGHASAYSEKSDVLYIYGGYDLNNVMSDLITYNFNTSTWTTLDQSTPNPGPLYGHGMTMLPNQEGFVIFGGQSSTNGQ